ncbi:(4Fe-4S)-binding protein [Nocardia ninae]|uniref:Ferredoxin n=1 Tax=Nocardia ninae NBRC 108245 TaxID=1210091 RepID=A0A511M629_9NOCA|nr:(4Fe-4S)-binding protein [Nocardia ninae]GEM36071.1 ferredoxin [Nocardia ninae NBRC 108245]
MRITADRTVCVGAGLCALTAPAVFDQGDDDGLVEVLDPAADDPAVREAVDLCPSGALALTE